MADSQRPASQSMKRITSEDLHAAADVVGLPDDSGWRIAEYGLTLDAIKDFIDESTWKDIDAGGPARDMDPLALAVGISIGVVAAVCPRVDLS